MGPAVHAHTDSWPSSIPSLQLGKPPRRVLDLASEIDSLREDTAEWMSNTRPRWRT
jgi:hypothetical protein